MRFIYDTVVLEKGAELQEIALYLLPKEALAKFRINDNCHSERSEESRIFKG